ncbi:TRAP-type C4-dicarboxylate transport system permease small subunit [Lewinella aquimaris]|uniref:TRAP-type C4-dicarboxylate transport system permease small subunit n=1 Tax=Neolewinella aquimaris TaxID=1835722 RepID=A0A840E2K1_9BACT|nr:TRAP transporter small permease subunit [Neolewinella aquimaris]MBB4077962.1 TRAP-type C4-dicarboxylate transport system permease small subunit [Neolewinella aquimaris]
MSRFIKVVGLGLKYGTFISTSGFVLVILIQIFARLFLATAPSWTEEAARVFFVIAIGCSAGLALRSGEYVNFDFFYQRMSPAWQRRLSFAIDLFTVVLFAIFTYYAVGFTIMGWAERSPSLKFPMAIPFAGMLLLGLSLLLYAVHRLRRHFTTNSPGK